MSKAALLERSTPKSKRSKPPKTRRRTDLSKGAENTDRSRDAHRTRALILQSALKEFAARGFGATSIRDIAARAVISHGMIRYYYETKEKLWFAAVEFLFDEMKAAFDLPPFTDDLSDAELKKRFRAWLRAWVHFGAHHPEHTRIIMQESTAPSKRLTRALRLNIRSRAQEALEATRLLQTRGILPGNVPAESILYFINSGCQQIFAVAAEARVIMDYDPLSDEAIEAHADAAIALLAPSRKR